MMHSQQNIKWTKCNLRLKILWMCVIFATKGFKKQDVTICAVARRELWSKIEAMSVIRDDRSSTHAHTCTHTHTHIHTHTVIVVVVNLVVSRDGSLFCHYDRFCCSLSQLFLSSTAEKTGSVILHTSKTWKGKCMCIPRRTSPRLAYSW
jgi:hypothetical protein